MSDFNLTVFRFNAVNPTIDHTSEERLVLPEDSSYLNVHIEFDLSEKYLSLYENMPGVLCSKWGDDSRIKVEFDENVLHNQITQASYVFVEEKHENPSIAEDMAKVLTTLYAWKI